MTLWRQVSIVLMVLLALVFVSTFVISIHSMHRFLITQMGSHSQDTASSLGLSISKHFAVRDMVSVSRTIDAIFDRGYYKRIMLKDVTGVTLYENVFSAEINTAPEWFKKIVNIPEIEAESMLLSGWHNVGTLHVTSNPDYAYFKLWNICKNNFTLFSLSVLICLFSSLFVLHKLLRPLRYVTEQAKAIANRNFLVQEKLPLTEEFRIVVETMNKMSVNLKEMFAQHVEFSGLMRERAYKDLVTGLGNRRYFESQLDHMLSSSESSISGAVILLRLSHMGEYRRKWGYKLGDILLKDVASTLTQLLNERNVTVLCHFGNYEFALVILNINYAEAKDITEDLLGRINALKQHEFVKEDVAGNIGCVVFSHDSFTRDILDKADTALRESQKINDNAIYVRELEQEKPAVTIDDWIGFFQEVISKKEVVFNYQPVFFYESNATLLFHNEILLRLYGPNREILMSGMFMPMAERLGLGVEIDKLVISLALERIAETPDGSQRYGINLSEAAIKEPKFIRWLSEACARSKLSIKRLNFEVGEKFVRENLDSVQELFKILQVYGAQVGIDHFGRGFSSFTYLNNISVDYLKIDGSYTRGIEETVDNQMIIRSFIEMGHSLGIVMIATAVETEEERDMLMKLHVDGMQGYFIGQPA
jgi:diguanylate cyclase (GGDEF)-like protein